VFRGHLARFPRVTGVGFGLKYPTNRGGLEAFDEAISEQEWLFSFGFDKRSIVAHSNHSACPHRKSLHHCLSKTK